MNTQCVQGTVLRLFSCTVQFLRFLHILTHLILTATLQRRYDYYPHLTNEETEAEYK